MEMRAVLDGLLCANLRALALTFRRPKALRPYLSHCAMKYEELAERGLAARGLVTPPANLTITLPAAHSGGGMSFTELVVLARVAKTLSPKTVFEMGTYKGLTTAVFILNTDPEARIFTLDLPVGSSSALASLTSDQELVKDRNLGLVPKALGLGRYTQLLADSMTFDPSPYLDSVDLGFVDAAHDLVHVRNDTIKMVRMMNQHGIIFWHDYGGRGAFRPLTEYLESLARRCPIYRVSETSLAWAPALELKSALASGQLEAASN